LGRRNQGVFELLVTPKRRATIDVPMATGEGMARWARGELKTGLGTDWAPRDLRHTFVSLMSADGVPIEEIARLAGHNRTATTELGYCRELRPVITTGAEVMDRILNLRG
jgi:integrase